MTLRFGGSFFYTEVAHCSPFTISVIPNALNAVLGAWTSTVMALVLAFAVNLPSVMTATAPVAHAMTPAIECVVEPMEQIHTSPFLFSEYKGLLSTQ